MQQHPLHPSKSYRSGGPPPHGEEVEPGGAEVGVVGPLASQGRSGRIAGKGEVQIYLGTGPQQVGGTTLGTQPAGRH